MMSPTSAPTRSASPVPRAPLWRKFGALILCPLLLAATLLTAAPVKFDIPPQSAAAALNLFGEQCGAEVIYPAAELKKVQSPGVVGEMEPAAAIARILTGTAFRAREIAPLNFAVEPIPTEQLGWIDGAVREAGSRRPVAGAKVELADSRLFVVTDRRGRFLLEGVPPGMHVIAIQAEGMQKTRVTDVQVRGGHRQTLSVISVPVQQAGTVQLEDYVVSAKKNDGTIELDPYDVYGSRVKAFSTANLDLTRTRDDALPFLTFSARDIEVSGAVNLEDFFRSRLAQDFSPQLVGQGNGSAGSPTQMQNTVDLRGWGNQETVILVNGRRLPVRYVGNQSDASFNLGDFSSIPMNSIERIEVLTSAGSAIYGANATGGVINIITRQDFRGGQLSLNYETPLDTHAPTRSVELNYGLPLPGKMHLRVVAGFQKTSPLTVEDRAENSVDRWIAVMQERDIRRLRGAQLPANPLVVGNTIPSDRATTNIRTVVVNANANLFGAGTPNYTSVPDGYAGGGGIQPFLTRQGVYSVSRSDGAASNTWGSAAWLSAQTERRNLTLGLDRRLSDDWRLSLDYTYQLNRSLGSGGYLDFSNQPLLVPAAAPTNPFGQDVFVAFDDPRMNRPELNRLFELTKNQVTITLRGEVGEWRGFVDLSYARDFDRWDYSSYSTPVGGWRAAFLSGAYNPFVDMRVVAPAAAEFYDRYVARKNDSASSMRNYSAFTRMSGPVLRLPAGSADLTIGAEWSRNERYQSYWFFNWVDSQTGALAPFFTGDPSRAQNTVNLSPQQYFTRSDYAVYAESNVPVISNKQAIPVVRRFDVFASGRLSRNEIDGSSNQGAPVTGVTKPYVFAAGVRWDPIDAVTVRASRSIGFKPPGVINFTPNAPPTTSTNVIDRRRGDQLVSLPPTAYLTGGNPDVNPETTTSTNYGVILSPKWMGSFRLSFDYLENVRDDAITTLGVQSVLDLESEIPSRVTRGPSDGHPSGVGPLTFVDARRINLRQISSKSADVSLEYQRENVMGGRLVATLAATKQLSFKVQATATGAAVEQVRNRTAIMAQALQWNANAQLRWEARRWSLGWSTRYFDSLLVPTNDLAVMQTDRIDWALNHDVFISHRIPANARDGWAGTLLNDTSITLGSRNVFDRAPRFWASNPFGAPYDSIMGRTVWLQIRKNF